MVLDQFTQSLRHYQSTFFFISEGFRQQRPPTSTVLATLDLSKAFDMVGHQTPLDLVHGTSVPGSLTRWLSNYLSGRQAKTFLGRLCKHPGLFAQVSHKAQSFHPFCLIFTFMVRHYHPPPPQVKLPSYADNFNPSIQSSNFQKAACFIHLFNKVIPFLASRSLVFSSSKGSAILFFLIQ